MPQLLRVSRRLLLCASLVCLLPPSSAGATSLALDFTAGNGVNKVCGSVNAPGCVGGWSFTVLSNITVTALGIWDEGSAALVSSHPVGLWTGDGLTQLATATVTNASTPVASIGPGRWLFESISPVVLTPGSYVIAAFYLPGDTGDMLRINTAAPSLIPQITLTHALAQLPIGSLTFPTIVAGSNEPGLFGANFQVEAQAVPEPASLTLLAMGLGTLFAFRRRRA